MDLIEYQKSAHSTSLKTKMPSTKSIKNLIMSTAYISIIYERFKKYYRDKKESMDKQTLHMALNNINNDLFEAIEDYDKNNNAAESIILYPALGLMGECGELISKLSHYINNGDDIDFVLNEEIKKEIGDVMWYLSEICCVLNISLNDAAEGNIKKLFSRRDRNVLTGDGDNR